MATETKRRKKSTVSYRIHDIRELEVYIPLLSEAVGEGFDSRKLDYGFKFDYIWSLEEDLFSVVIEVKYTYDREGLNEVILSYIGEVEYKVSNLNHFVDVGNGEIDLPEELLGILTGISISTVRGMIATRTFGKFQGDYYLPILSPKKVVEDYFKTQEEA